MMTGEKAANIIPTSISMPAQVGTVDDEVVVGIEFPELAVDDVEMLVGEEIADSVDVVLAF